MWPLQQQNSLWLLLPYYFKANLGPVFITAWAQQIPTLKMALGGQNLRLFVLLLLLYYYNALITSVKK